MYKTVDSCGALLARIVRGNVTVGYLFLDYMTNNKYPITKESAVMMTGNKRLSMRINTNEDTLYIDKASRIRSKGNLKLGNLPVIKEDKLNNYYK